MSRSVVLSTSWACSAGTTVLLSAPPASPPSVVSSRCAWATWSRGPSRPWQWRTMWLLRTLWGRCCSRRCWRLDGTSAVRWRCPGPGSLSPAVCRAPLHPLKSRWTTRCPSIPLWARRTSSVWTRVAPRLEFRLLCGRRKAWKVLRCWKWRWRRRRRSREMMRMRSTRRKTVTMASGAWLCWRAVLWEPWCWAALACSLVGSFIAKVSPWQRLTQRRWESQPTLTMRRAPK
mmetsp:Transcript_23305/g.53130  ORF Transcript_23305/g.53130 Transcript_23305/m.53130 type:complete len:231 (+) Transcript_23305:135-827(+)